MVGMRVFEDYQVNVSGTQNTVSTSFTGSTVEIFPNSAQIDNTPPNMGVMVYFRNLPPEICADFINGISSLTSNITTANTANVALTGDALANTVKTSTQGISLNNLATACTPAVTGAKITVAALISNSGIN